MFHLCTPWKRQKTCGFLTFPGGTGMEHWREMDQKTFVTKVVEQLRNLEDWDSYKKVRILTI